MIEVRSEQWMRHVDAQGRISGEERSDTSIGTC